MNFQDDIVVNLPHPPLKRRAMFDTSLRDELSRRGIRKQPGDLSPGEGKMLRRTQIMAV
ncbi:MAG: hypothetical protein QTN59_00085 [Candidatus Electrothrix communis]|nr:hypothetical protein [Desulfobulbus sp. US4]WLE97241.1 MAG: hypothetical protein QTN59_00085 [Candidatus Electrothrix communis]